MSTPAEANRPTPSGKPSSPGSETAGGKTIVVLPAYNAERTLADCVRAIPPGVADELIVVDDGSADRTVEIAEGLGVSVLRHPTNRGYGANQKTCYRAALERGADYVVMLHPDLQYEPRLVPIALEVLRLGIADVVLGNRIRTRAEALQGGMPAVKYLANRSLTLIENVLSGQNLGEWHSGFRGYRRQVLEEVPFAANADGFVFDSQFLLQAIHCGFRLAEIPMPVRYFAAASSIRTAPAARYALGTLWTFVRWFLHRSRLLPCPLFRRPPTPLG